MTDVFIETARELSRSEVFGYAEADRGLFDFACVLTRDNSRHLVGIYAVAAEILGCAVRTIGLGNLQLNRDGRRWLAVVKNIQNGNATAAVQWVVGALEYESYFSGVGIEMDRVAVFSEPIGAAYEAFLESLGIRAIWWNEDGLGGSGMAWKDSLIPVE
ncbi:hypothetical protein [Nocardia panacis]|uniref:hypothetical protein n=1 Tax=Nocardia panacis TaxID=2340916 RepID=UPI0011C40A15|nr:hypothetical protein [Nocardia panacis]